MTVLIGLQNVVSFFGGVVRLNYSKQHDFVPNEIITGATSGATAIVKELSHTKREIIIEPTSDDYFTIAELITGSQSLGSSIAVILCEVTAVKLFYDSAVDFIKKYTGKLYGSILTGESITLTTRSGDRYINLLSLVVGPITIINSLILNGTTMIEDSNFYVNLRTGRIDFNTKLSTPAEPNNLIINYDAGTLTVPESVRTAAILYINWLWQSRNQNLTTKGAQSMSFHGRSVNFGKPVTDKELEGILPEISALLKKNAKIRVG